MQFDCDHEQQAIENAEYFADWEDVGTFCFNMYPHGPHDACLGIMCDSGCNAEYF